MKAIIEVDVPDFQIGQEVSIYFKDTMMIKGVVQEPCTDSVSIEAVIEWLKDKDIIKLKSQEENARKELQQLYSVNPQKPRTGHWITVDYQRGLYECSECHTQGYVDTEMYKPTWVACPRCGARMESEE